MRLAYLGNFGPPESTENHWKYAFAEHGVEVVPVQQDRATMREWEAVASECEAATLSTTWGWPMPCNRGVWDRLGRRGVRTFSLHLDLLHGLPRADLFTKGHHPQFFGPERVWTSDGTDDGRWGRLGIDHRWLAPAIHAPNATLGTPSPEWDCDVLFVGSVANYHPEWTRRRALVDGARARWGDRFRHIGDAGNVVRGPGLSDVYASATVVLGDSLCFDLGRSRYFSDRVPETAGRGGVLVHPSNAAAPRFEGAAVWSSDDWSVDAQLDLADDLLGVEDLSVVRSVAHAVTVERHTYTHRAAEILADLIA